MGGGAETSRNPGFFRGSVLRPPAAAAPYNAGAEMPAAAPTIRFRAPLARPAGSPKAAWTFVALPREASAKLRSRAPVSVAGTLNGVAFRATLQPDGQGSHWLKVERRLREQAGAAPGDAVALEFAPVAEEPEPAVPADLRKALASAAPKARAAWTDITPLARRDWVQWVTSAKLAETRARRVDAACDMLAKGKRRPCCFDRSGMYGKGLKGPTAS